MKLEGAPSTPLDKGDRPKGSAEAITPNT